MLPAFARISAEHVFFGARSEVVNYTAVLTAYGRRGDFHKATELLEEMRQARMRGAWCEDQHVQWDS